MTATTGILAALGSPFASAVGMVIWDKHWSGSEFALNLFVCTLATMGFLILSTTTRPPDELFPADIFTGRNIGFLILSSTIGILIGDWTWFKSLSLIGPVRVALFGTFKPFFAAFLGWAILDEELAPPAWGGMVLTMGGILWVSLETIHEEEDVSEKKEVEENNDGDSPIDEDGDKGTQRGSDSFYDEPTKTCISREDGSNTENEDDTSISKDGIMSSTEAGLVEHTAPKDKKKKKKKKKRKRQDISTNDLRMGYFMSAVNIVMDTFGSVITKQYGVGMTTWEINLIRFGFASAVLLTISFTFYLWYRLVPNVEEPPEIEVSSVQIEDAGTGEEDNEGIRPWYTVPHLTKKAWGKISLGVAFNAFLCPALSNYALFQIALALVLTLTSIEPIYTLPLNWLLQKERPTQRSCIGAVIACAGVAILSFFGS